MLSVSSSSSPTVTRSSLEEMLESIRKRDERPKDTPPALPVRPVSKARLPTGRRSLPHNFKIGHPTALPDYDIDSQGQPNKRDQSSMTSSKDEGGEDLGFESNKVPKVNENDGPVVEQQKLDSDLQNDRCKSSKSTAVANIPCVLDKEFQVWFQLSVGQWESGKIESAFVDDFLVVPKDGTAVMVPRKNILPANPEILEGTDDLIHLIFLNEPSVFHNLQSRYYNDKFYTKAGRSLLAINPFKDLELHQEESLSRQKPIDPYVYAAAETAFNDMMRDGESQSFIVSGESGAGKSEVAKIVTRCLAFLGGENKIDYRILQTNSILDAFGNAKTSMNRNSSRFGKLIEIQFSATGKVCGAKVETFLLEKSRVVQLAKGERSFHIFYQLCAGAPSFLKERLNLKSPMEFNYLKQSGCLTIDDVDDARMFHMLMDAFDTVQISKEDQENVFSLLSAVLWLGNISFHVIDNENHVNVIPDEAVSSASKLLGCNVQDLTLTLSTRQNEASNDNFVQQLTLPQAIDTRDALAKSIYTSLFDWIVVKINKSLETNEQEAWRSISITDIFGFESRQKNGFEQLHINYCNERMRQHLNQQLLKLEQEEYIEEGIDWNRVDFEDNQECVDLFEQESYGLLSLLDEESKHGQATDKTLANKLKHHLSSRPHFKGNNDGTFSVYHYAGEVLYDTSGFLEKNNEPLHSDCIQFLSSCTHELLQLFASNMLNPSQMLRNPFLSSATDSEKKSVGMKFKDQLFKLLQQLESTKSHFICCIKPNNMQLPNMFEENLVLQQLRSCGVLDIVRISRLGYPTRMKHQEFTKRYGILHSNNVASQTPLSRTVEILQQFNINPDAYQVGYTKLFFRTGQLARLEEAIQRLLQCIITVQKCFRGHITRRHLFELAERITTLQSTGQVENTRKENQNLIKRLGTVSSTGSISSETSDTCQRAAILLQSVTRGWLVRKHSQNMAKLSKSNHYAPNAYNQLAESTTKKEDLKQEHSVVAELQAKLLKAEAVINQKEEENAVLQQQVKQFQNRWAEQEARMKSMEESWQKQMSSLQMNLTAAKTTLSLKDVMSQNGETEATPIPHDSDSDTVSAPRTPVRRPPAKLPGRVSNSTPSRESNGGLNAVSHLVKELEQHKQVFNHDVKILVEVKSGHSASTKYSYEDLQKVKKNFEAWKKEFKDKLQEAKRTLKRGNPESGKTHKTWWGKMSSRKT